jgi:CRISPR-associated protein Cas1
MELVLNTFGSYLTKNNQQFLVTHRDGRQTFSPKDIKTISIGKGAQISSDAAMLAIEFNIDVFFVDTAGTPVGRIWSNKFGSFTEIRRKQIDFSFSPKAITWIKEIISEKIDNQMALLFTFSADALLSADSEKSIRKLEDYKQKIKMRNDNTLSEMAASLRGWEGAASKAYFGEIAKLLTGKCHFTERSQHPANDMFNALLNYGYGILYGRIEASLIKAGIDPYVGVFHREDYNRPVLVFDIIEKYRVWVDYVVIMLCMQQAVPEDAISKKDDGSVWLEALGKRIIIQSMNDYLQEVIKIGGLERSREEQIRQYAHKLAKVFLNY